MEVLRDERDALVHVQVVHLIVVRREGGLDILFVPDHFASVAICGEKKHTI